MPYTVWSRGRLIGESELAYVEAMPGLRAGDFEPSQVGETLMPIIVGVGPAAHALYDAVERVRREDEDAGRDSSGEAWPGSIRHTTEYADALSVRDELESLALELRDPAGAVVATDWIAVQDTHRLLALARDELASLDLDAEGDSAGNDDGVDDDDPWIDDLGADDVEPWQPAPARYQILVGLAGFDDRMASEAITRR